MVAFVLVHGAWHGAWCWERLIPELEGRGHDAITMDLPCADPTATFADYAEVVVQAAAHVTDEVVLVGHSLGAMTVPLVAAQRPVASMVLLCPVVPNLDGYPWDDVPRADVPGTFDPLVTLPDGSTVWPDPESAASAFYNRASPEDAAWAFARLRPQSNASLWSSRYPLDAWPAARTAAVCCTDDRAIQPENVRIACQDRFGIEPVEIPGDHSPFLAQAPLLADLLVELTT